MSETSPVTANTELLQAVERTDAAALNALQRDWIFARAWLRREMQLILDELD